MSNKMVSWRSIAPATLCCALLCAGVLLAGCGASTQSSASARYVAQGNRICTTQLALLHRLPMPTTPEQAIDYLPHALTIMHRENVQLRTIDPASSKQTELNAALVDTDRLTALLSRFLHSLKTGVVELTTFGQVEGQSSVLRSQIDAEFRRAGLTRCAS